MNELFIALNNATFLQVFKVSLACHWIMFTTILNKSGWILLGALISFVIFIFLKKLYAASGTRGKL